MEMGRNKFIDYWACIYIFTVIMISLVTSSFNVAIFLIYFVMALPFVNSIEHYCAISLMLSTISYYFVGAYEEVYSIYTILIVLAIFRALFFNKGKIKVARNSLLLLLPMCILAVVSYSMSPFNYSRGLFRLLYLLVICIIIGYFTRLRLTKLCRIIPQLAEVMVIGYIISVLVSGSYVDGRLTIANDINTNTFGMSCAQLSCILLISFVINDKKKKIKLILSIVVAGLAFLSGSRGALLAFILASAIVIIIYAKKEGRLIGAMFKMAIFEVVLLGAAYIIIIFTGLDTSRFSFTEVVASGGSRRGLIYSTLIPYIIQNGYWKFGYGPGHDCSRQVILSLIHWDYTHSHNTFLESFGELGIGGLLILIICIIAGIKNLYTISKKYKEAYLLMAMLLCLLINGMAESYFFDAILWLLLAICCNNFVEKRGE